MKINLPKMQKSLVKFFAFTLALFILFSSNVAIASQIPTPFPLKIDISGGTFSVDTKEIDSPLTDKVVVRRAILSLPSDQKGTINSIQITAPTVAKPEGGLIFGCNNIKVKDGTDLIKACGGPAELLPGGKLRYKAEGSGFDPNETVSFEVKLYDDFNGES